MVTLDFFIVNVAVPTMQADLGATPTSIEWVVAGYGLAFAAGLILGGRLGDHYGRRRMFAVGLELFTLASLACGLAPGAALLMGARVAQGVAAALMTPQVLAIIGLVYPGPADRARAFTAYSLTMGFGGIGGQLIGGALIRADVAGLGWRMCFLINLPVGVAALVGTRRYVPESRADGHGRLDLAGAGLISSALVAIVLPLVEGRRYGWPAWTWVSLVIALVLLAEFVWWEQRVARRGGIPLVDMGLFRSRAFSVGTVSTLTYFAGMASFFLVLALYLQLGRGLGALESGEIFSLLGIGFLAASMAQVLAARTGRQALALGALVLAAGLVLFRLDAGGSTLALVPAFLVDGAGMGIVMAPLTVTVLSGMDARDAGSAAGVLSSVQQVGNAIGVAIIGIVFYGAGPDVVHAFEACIPYLVGFAAAVAVLVQLLRRRR